MKIKGILLLILFFLVLQSNAQTTYKNREYSLANDNDVYLLIGNDRYYSNGIIFHKRWVRGGEEAKKDTSKAIFDFEFAHKTYTPQDLILGNPRTFDRPYAGLLTIGLSQQYFHSKSFSRTIGLELGVVGDISGARVFQEWYHKQLGFPKPRGWDSQIPNEFIVNFKGGIAKQVWLKEGVSDLILDSEAFLGTGFTHITQRFDFRFGQLQDLERSSFKNAIIGKGSDKFKHHNYFFFGYGVQLVAQNIVIGGSLFNNDAPHTENPKGLVHHWRVGWATNSHNTTFKMIFNGLSAEVEGNKIHGYITFELGLRLTPTNPYRLEN